MAADESMFMRTVLALNDQFMSEDTSLALPSDDRLTGVESHDGQQRRNRVEQQVQQLTLSRKAKRPIVRDNLSSSQPVNTATYKNGSAKLCTSFNNKHVLGPNRYGRKMDISQWSSHGIPQINGGYGMSRYGSYGNGIAWQSAGLTLPIMRSVSSADRLYSTFPSQHVVWSDMPKNSQQFVSYRSTTLQLPSKSVYEDNTDDVFLPDSSHLQTPLQSGDRKMFWERQNIKKAISQQGDMASWIKNAPFRSQDIRERQENSRRLPSQSSSLVSMPTNSIAVAKEQETAADTVKQGKQNTQMTLRLAVHHLSDKNTEKQLTAANFIQNQCFNSTDAKKTMFFLQGIPKLLKLMDSESEEVQRAAAAALRNVLYKNSENKMEVKDCDGVAVILRLLRRNRDTETRRQLTGLLWNLSSHDMLKEQLGREAVQPLTDNVLVPCSGISEGENPKLELLSDPEVFLNATGCLRNVSSTGPNGRKAMRECDNLIDSLVYYVRGTIADYKPDDQALENAVCILHNLTYQFESELPEKLKPVVQESRQSAVAETQRPGCLVMKNTNERENVLEPTCPMLEENGNPHGVEWLWNTITIRMYLSLLATSHRQSTQEAALGAMQNLTAGSGEVSQAVANTIVQREGGLLQVNKMLLESEEEVKRASVGLIKNVSRYKELHSEIIKQTLPELVSQLYTSESGAVQRTEVTSVCHILNHLSQASVQNARTVFDHGVLPRIIKISSKDRYGPTRAGQAASLLLHTLWKHSELHGSYKKAGYRKTDFINNRTVKAVNSAHN